MCRCTVFMLCFVIKLTDLIKSIVCRILSELKVLMLCVPYSCHDIDCSVLNIFLYSGSLMLLASYWTINCSYVMGLFILLLMQT